MCVSSMNIEKNVGLSYKENANFKTFEMVLFIQRPFTYNTETTSNL